MSVFHNVPRVPRVKMERFGTLESMPVLSAPALKKTFSNTLS